MWDETITFEQPLNEYIRVCLRLEHLFQQITANINANSIWGTRVTLEALLEILNVIDRPDLKSKLTTALNLHINTLSQMEKLANVDKTKLHRILEQLDRLTDCLQNTAGKFGQELRENDFLHTIRQRMLNPGGACNFSVPAYHLWLRQPQPVKQKELNTWLKIFAPLQEIVNLLLKLTRESTTSELQTAKDGFFQHALDPSNPLQMIRVTTPAVMTIYPDISVGRHRLSVHFFILNSQGHAQQAKHDIQFRLALCKI